AGLLSAPVASLTEGVLKAMFVTRIKIAAVVVLALVLLGTSVGVVGHTALAARDADDPRQEKRSGVTGERIAEPPPVNKDAPPQAGKAPDAPANESGWQERITLSGHTGHVMTVVFSPDAKQLVTGSLDGSVRTWDVASGKEIRRVQAGPGESVSAVAFTPDGKLLATGGGQLGKSGVVRLIDVSTGQIVRTLEGFPDIGITVTVSPDGRMARAGGRDGLATAWDLNTGKRFFEIKTRAGTLFSLTLSPDGRWLASAGGEEIVKEGNKAGELKLWDLATGKEIRELKDGTDTVTSVSFSP